MAKSQSHRVNVKFLNKQYQLNNIKGIDLDKIKIRLLKVADKI